MLTLRLFLCGADAIFQRTLTSRTTDVLQRLMVFRSKYPREALLLLWANLAPGSLPSSDCSIDSMIWEKVKAGS